MEFGVFRGDTINRAADYRKMFCEEDPPPIYGFDTFQGLPEAWGEHMQKVIGDVLTLAVDSLLIVY